MAERLDLLFELGTEELPPKSLHDLSLALEQGIAAGLRKAGVEHGEIRSYATPRRLALHIRDLATAQPDQELERRGPALAAAYNADGSLSKAAEGFLKSCGATAEQLTTLRTDKGEWLCVRQQQTGVATRQLLPDILRASLAALPIPKRMRWGDGVEEFVRPAHWVVLLLGGELIEAEILGLATGKLSRGHRIHHPQTIELNHADEYREKLRAAFVIADFSERRESIRQQAQASATALGGLAHVEEALLDEVTALVEWPVAVVGNFDARFLDLPPEVPITTMQANQKYFPVRDGDGKLLPHFITFANLQSTNPDSVRKGNERVVLPRLTDAEFFWNQDRKQTLQQRVAKLANISFQKTLGSLLDKTHRVQRLAREIARLLGIDHTLVKRAALLAKADLLTEMVGEFPELQGLMGRYYALAEGEDAEVAAAIEEQYLPKVSGGALPVTVTGRILALAEKLDTLSGIFSAGLIPSGDKDPYALRRAALGLLRNLLEGGISLDLQTLISFSLEPLSHNFDRAVTAQLVRDFILERLRGLALDQGYGHDEIDAVLEQYGHNPLNFQSRIAAVREFRALPEAESLSAANKRIRNILRKTDEEFPANPDTAQLVEGAERQLLDAVHQADADLRPLLDSGDYTAALQRLARLREPVDGFFDGVMVMAEDPALRHNRLSLLARVEALFLEIADISRLQSA